MRSSPATTSAGRPASGSVSSSAAIRNGRSDEDTKARCGARGGLARQALDVVVLDGAAYAQHVISSRACEATGNGGPAAESE